MAIIGIDLGTTNSLACVYRESGPELIPNEYGSFITPSVVATAKDEIIVGMPARRMLLDNPDNAASLFKRRMGSDEKIKIGNRAFLPEELSSFIISSLVKNAELYLGEKVDEAVISVPAYFYDEQRVATKKAGMLAGVKCERIINEPSSAALATFWAEGKEDTLLIFDFGGGTLDVSIVDCIGNAVSVVSIAGNNMLGGSDFDRIIAESALKEHSIASDEISNREYEKLLLAAELCKKKLSDNDSSELNVEIAGRKIKSSYDTKRLAEESRDILTKIKIVIEDAVKDSFMSMLDISRVVMVGGSSKMPLVQSYIKYLFRQAPIIAENCDETVAYGVGLFSAIKARIPGVKNYILSDVCPFSLCTGTYNSSNPLRSYSTVMISKNSVLPCSVEDTFWTVRDNQSSLEVSVLQGEKPYEDQNKLLGKMKIKVPKKPAGEVKIKLRFTYDINGILVVETYVPLTGEKKSMIISGKMSDEEVAKAIKELEKYKIDYREVEENKELLGKLEYLIESNVEEARDYYFRLFDHFNAVLDSQNRYRIDKSRFKINQIIKDEFRSDTKITVESFIDSLDSDDEEMPDEWEVFDKWIN